MFNIKIGPFIKSIAIALVFFAIGRLVVVQMGGVGSWIILIGLVVFYAVWWVFYQRGKKRK
jgi:hypothetical protein